MLPHGWSHCNDYPPWGYLIASPGDWTNAAHAGQIQLHCEHVGSWSPWWLFVALGVAQACLRVRPCGSSVVRIPSTFFVAQEILYLNFTAYYYFPAIFGSINYHTSSWKTFLSVAAH